MDTNELNALAAEYHAASKSEKKAKDLKSAIKDSIVALLGETKTQTTDMWKVTKVEKEGGWRLDEKLLLENGVPVDVINASKVQGKPSMSIRVTKQED